LSNVERIKLKFIVIAIPFVQADLYPT
jgi:hypothetical protein